MNDLDRVRIKISEARSRLTELETTARVLEEIAAEAPATNGTNGNPKVGGTGLTQVVFGVLSICGKAKTAKIITMVGERMDGASSHSVRSILSLSKKRGRLGRKKSGEWFILNGDAQKKRPQGG